ncbi:MAG: glycosyltransferase, partial [Muribaculaceae bacterium]|nr:glycosyltransferase [Muribaculaceae bacterium]
MRIVYTCQTTTVRGGLERIIVDKANAMASAGHEVCLIVNNSPDCVPAYATAPGVKVVDLAMKAPHGVLSRLRYKIVQNTRIFRALRHFRPDIVVAAPSWLTLSMIFGPGRLVLESHSSRGHMFDSEKQSAYKRWKVSAAERRSECVVTLTAAEAACWPHARRTEVIPNYSEMNPPAQAGERRNAMAIGRLAEVKQFDLLVDAWRDVTDKHPDASLDIFGDGELRSTLQSQIERLDLSKNVRLCGATENPAAEYATHNFLVLSSDYEGFGLVLIEAMRCGCPCVATDCPEGPREIIEDGVDGILVDYRDRSRDERVALLA